MPHKSQEEIDILVEEHIDIAQRLTERYCSKMWSVDKDDVFSELQYWLVRDTMSYDYNRNNNFKGYITMKLNRRLQDYHRKLFGRNDKIDLDGYFQGEQVRGLHLKRVSLDYEVEEGVCLHEVIKDNNADVVVCELDDLEFLIKTADLNDQEDMVIQFYYFDNMKLREIAELLDLTESRICQIHNSALMKLKSTAVVNE